MAMAALRRALELRLLKSKLECLLLRRVYRAHQRKLQCRVTLVILTTTYIYIHNETNDHETIYITHIHLHLHLHLGNSYVQTRREGAPLAARPREIVASQFDDSAPSPTTFKARTINDVAAMLNRPRLSLGKVACMQIAISDVRMVSEDDTSLKAQSA